MSSVGLVRSDQDAEHILERLFANGITAQGVWIASRSKDLLDNLERRFGVETVREGVYRQGVVADFARSAGFGDERTSEALLVELLARGVDDRRARYFSAELTGKNVLIGVDAAQETLGSARVLLDDRVDLGFEQAAAETIIHLRREVLNVVKHAVVDGEVTIRTEIVEETKTIEVTLEREELVIEHLDLLASNRQPTITRIAVRHEEAIINKAVVVTAEVNVRTDKVVETSTVTETLRHELLRVDDPNDVVNTSRPTPR